MLYLSPRFIETEHRNFGWITSPRESIARRHLLQRPWVMDNGVFTGLFDESVWKKTLDKLSPYQQTCLFIVTPDVVADSKETEKKWVQYSPLIKDMGYKAGFVAQDGCLSIPDDADALFIGGSTHFKLSTAAMNLVHCSIQKGLWIHMGRVNSKRRFHYAESIGCHSVDGTCIAIAEKNKYKIISWMDQSVIQF